jgi:C-terminal processing protease CtpA/Prc
LIAKLTCLVMMVALFTPPAWSQHADRLLRERAQVMLQEVAADIRNHYYDPKLHGVDWDARVEKAKEAIANATSNAELALWIEAVLETLDDSHTSFIPPGDPIRPDYGWRFQMIGSRCFVTEVRPKSDAEAKGLEPGDEVLTIDGFTPTRESLNKMEYLFNVLQPQSGLRVVLRNHFGKIRQVDVMAQIRQAKTIIDLDDVTGGDPWRLRLEYEDRQRLNRPQYKEFGKELMILKLPAFSPTDGDLLHIIDEARNYDCLILDLRDNPGGAEPTFRDLLGRMFGSDVKIADRITRETTQPLTAEGARQKAFTGKLIVLVDSRSASASELFARVIQLEKRGVVLGDHTSGSVMEAHFYGHTTGNTLVFTYGTSVSTADLIMSDGKSLERTGVTPDETILPTAADLANGRDPVLTRAAEMAGITLSPKEAGNLFPFQWLMN